MRVPDVLGMRCLPGWRGVFCVLDNLVPHGTGVDEDGDEYKEGGRGFRWVCRLHDRASDWREG